MKNEIRTIEREAKVETLAGVITIPVKTFSVEFNGDEREFKRRADAAAWLRDKRKAINDAKRDTETINKIVSHVDSINKLLGQIRQAGSLEYAHHLLQDVGKVVNDGHA